MRVGIGYDIHRFCRRDENRPLMLGGVHFPDHAGLDGHSDADVLCHAIADALLGAAAKADIGYYFPPNESKWKNLPGLELLTLTRDIIFADKFAIVNIDSTVVAESPKILPRRKLMQNNIASALRAENSQIGVKATTNECLGAIGRKEGICVMAVALLQKVEC